MAVLRQVVLGWILLIFAKEQWVLCQDVVGTCEPIKVDICKGVGYNLTFSQSESHQSEQEAKLLKMKPLLDSGCSKDIQFFLCSFFFPQCDNELFSLMGPCQELCSDVAESCKNVLEEDGLKLDCSQLPSEHEQPRQCLQVENVEVDFHSKNAVLIDKEKDTSKEEADSSMKSSEIFDILVNESSVASTSVLDHQTITIAPIVKESGYTENEIKSDSDPEQSQVETKRNNTDIDPDKSVDQKEDIVDEVEENKNTVDYVKEDEIEVDEVEAVQVKPVEFGPAKSSDKGMAVNQPNRGMTVSTERGNQPVSTCEPLHVDMCKQFGYNHTKMPNFAGHVSLVEATLEQSAFISLVHTGCSSQLAFLLCSVYTPACHDRFPDPVPPCRSVCANVRTECLAILNQFGLSWPAELNCMNFPLTQEEKCLQGSADIFRVHWQPKLKTVEKTQTFVVTTNNTVVKGSTQINRTATDIHSSDVCLKDKETGPCSNYTIRWFYNKDQKGCRQFWYGGCNAGANNFETREDCQNKCEETKSGSDGNEGEKIVAAQCRQNEDRGPCTQYKVQWYYNYNEKRCQRFWYGGCRGNTNRFDNEEMCKSTCTSSSVIETTTPKPVDKSDIKDTGSTDICQLPNDMGKCREFKVKWFHNATARECGRFWYGGCEGNGNNFNSREDCEARCIQKVTTFAPITTTKPGKCPRLSIANIGACVRECQVDQDCSGNQKCCSNGCGMTCQDPGDSYLLTPPVDIKADMVSTGIAFVTWTDVQAADAVERRFYSVRYKAVGDSRYETLNTTAQQVYVTGLQPNQQYEFSVKVIQGTKYSLWSISAYNRTLSGSPIYKTGECPALRQGEGGICVEGCSNDYDCSGDMKCCSNGCGRECVKPEIVEVAPEPTLAPQPAAHYCTQESLRGPCQNYTVNWYFSPQDGRCRRFWYGGCDGNQNNFKTEADCDAACRRSATVEDVCQLPEVPGPCKAAHRKWYHDQSARECREFIYGGCRGNQNNFNTRAECLIRCGSDETKLKVNGLRAMNKSWNKVTLEWDPPVMAKEVRQYRLSYMGERYYRDQVQRDSVSVLDIPGSVSSYSINGLKPATQYRFNLTAITGNGQRGPTEQIITNTMSQNEYKDGECPRVDLNSNINENCDRLCQTDYDCDGDYKCCRDRCGMSCQAPRVRESSGLCVDAQYGCCLDGVTAAQGPNYQGCPDACQGSKYGCCDDGVTSATGPNQDGCEIGSGDEDNFCEQSVFKCCADGITPAQGPNKEGCVEYVPPSTPKPDLGPVCQQAPKRGPCTDYKVKYFYNATISRCDRFWYGGCDGNNNNFDSDEDCQAACVKKEVTLPVCEQPKQTGKCRGYIKRFYFNKDTEQCEEFIYGGCDGNDNNFENEVDCQRKCAKGEEITSAGNRCQLSADVGPCKGNIKRWYYNSQNGECVEFGWGGCEGNLNNFIDKETCLSKCSVQILPADKEPRDICRLPSEVGRCRASVQRWFYDFNEGKCKQFIYGGCDGNENNFETRELCESGCSRAKVCQPYYVPAIQCLAYIRRYQYIAASQDCQEFIYGGCGGNSNNFATIEACRGKCVESEPKTYDNICALKPEAGPCRERNIKWFYNTTTSRCEKFIYGGCHGNPNKFDSQDECDSFCTEGSGDIDVEVTSVDSSYCHLPKESGECENSFPAWYYDHLDGVCKEFVFGGCGGNKNRFTSREVCESSCSREAVCKLQPQQGDCGDNFRRYYHDARSGQCKEFLYNGCKGNANNFGTREACGNKCGDDFSDLPVQVPAPFNNPNIPRNVSAVYINGGVNVTWLAPLDVFQHISYYIIQIKTPNSDWTQIPDKIYPPTTSYFTLDVMPGTIYRFRIYSVDGENFSGESNEALVSIAAYEQTDVRIPWDICRQPKDYGTCTGHEVKYYFDTAINDCRPFWYSTCGGNNNRFSDPTECRQRCLRDSSVVTLAPVTTTPVPLPTPDPTSVIIIGSICQEKDERGPCSNYTVKWYYNKITGICERFWYGGCEGNGNRFESQEACQKRCMGQTPVQPGDTGEELEVGDATQIVEQPDRNVFIECRGPKGTVSWYKNRYIITSDGHYTIFANGSMLITSLTKEDSGVYACSIDYGGKEPAVQRFRIQVEVPITILPTPSSIVLKPGETAILSCQAQGNPEPTITWSKDGQSIRNSERYYSYTNGTLVITNVELGDIGDYTCTARNGQSSVAQKLIRLTLRESVSAKIKPANSRLREGETLYLTCDGRGYPAPAVRWEKLGVQLFTTDRMTVNGGNLRITNVKLDDTGLYKCVASNEQEKSEDDQSIQVIPKDTEIANCVDSASVTMCRLIVRAGLCDYTMYSTQCCYSCDHSKRRG